MSRIASCLLHRWAKPAVFAVAAMPFAWLVYAVFTSQLGPNPAETLIRSTGELAIRFLCFTLAITPLRVLTSQAAWMRFRRMLGLFMFFYATLHLLCYSAFDMEFVLTDIVQDVLKRPFILVGLLSFVLLLPLAATSFDRAIRTLGAPRWRRLHRAVYAVALLAVLHFFWMRAGKNNFADVAFYASVLGLLLAWRVVHALKVRLQRR